MPTPQKHRGVTYTDGDLYTMRDTAHKGHVSVKTVRRLIQSGTLKSFRIGAQIRISEADWQAYLVSARQS